MKINLKFLKNQLTLGLIALTLLLASCGKDTDLNQSANENLCGIWDVSSLTIDGTEAIGKVYVKFTMDFDCEDITGGEVEWLLIDLAGATTLSKFDYEMTLEATEMTIGSFDFDYEGTGSKITLDGNVDGNSWVIKAKKK